MSSITKRTARPWRLALLHGARCFAVTALATCSSCATPEQAARHLPHWPGGDPSAYAGRTSQPADPLIEHAVVHDRAQTPGGIQPLQFSPLQQAVFDADAGSARIIQPTAHTHTQDGAEAAPIQHADEPRMPLPGVAGGMVPVVAAEEPPYPEEMLCDGGDRGYPFHYEGGDYAGLEPEDTIAEYVDHTGEAHVRVSTRACVYAPKFGALRSITQPVIGASVDKLAGTRIGTAAGGIDTHLALDIHRDVDQVIVERLRTSAGAVDARLTEGLLRQNTAFEQHVKVVAPYEQRGAFSEGQLQQTSEPYLASTLQIAGETILNTTPIIVASDQFGQAVTSVERVEEYSVAEDRRPPGELRIVKHADRPTAQPGDVITFRIRFFNDGGRELHDVRILDHLSPRLEYVAGSAVSELEGQLNVETDDYGTQVLRFELESPLAGGQSGEITFQAVAK